MKQLCNEPRATVYDIEKEQSPRKETRIKVFSLDVTGYFSRSKKEDKKTAR